MLVDEILVCIYNIIGKLLFLGYGNFQFRGDTDIKNKFKIFLVIKINFFENLIPPPGPFFFYFSSHKQYILLLYFPLKPGVQFKMQDTA
jgi:hypothetical protein